MRTRRIGMWLPTLGLAAIAGFWAPPSQADEPAFSPRLTVTSYRYAGPVNAETEDLYVQLYWQCSDKLAHFRETFLRKDAGFGYLDGLRLFPETPDKSLPPRSSHPDTDLEYWDRSYSLILSRGQFHFQGKETRLSARVFLGNFLLQSDRYLDAGPFLRTEDATLFLTATVQLALALDARRNQQGSWIVAEFLAEARNAIVDMERELTDEQRSSLDRLKDLVAKAQERERARGGNGRP